ncbi:MAG: TIGR04283 family arsenosugar biosynthesis glycosyltransferase [Desulfuromonadales bacterium]|nr:TIGR04283 family arsenosugar biosynthesis glycosyltransferase [Desulfuromonadales bacterium]MBN2791221.1 TIGR04283 family arsenosugar biosynthesis glycosyltransferase [Desulfuromonadales bacterium]
MPDNFSSHPELSLIVPVLNERDELPLFLAALSSQLDVNFELILCDGGSTDGSLQWLSEYQVKRFGLKVVACQPGRARQLNHGVRFAQADWLLFLHVDSRFEDCRALRKALDHLQTAQSHKVAGHFPLTFRHGEDLNSAAYYFYEWKARLGLPETIHGDQGFLLSRPLFRQVGPFSEALTVMEDTEFAERLRLLGQWQLLPVAVSTSARRFESEGLWQRQILGALIMCFRSVGWDDFFSRAPNIYRQQSRTEKLRLSPYFQLITELLGELSLKARWTLWYRSGCYVRNHGWQLFFALDAGRAFRAGLKPGQGRTAWLDCMLPLYDFLTDNFVGRCLATGLLRCWFELMRRGIIGRESR